MYAFNAAVLAKLITLGMGVVIFHVTPVAMVLLVRFIPLNGALTAFGQTLVGPEIPKIGRTSTVIVAVPPQPGSSVHWSGKLQPAPVSTF